MLLTTKVYARAVALKLAGLVVKVAPGKRRVVDGMGAMIGLPLLLSGPYRRKGVRMAKKLQPGAPTWPHLVRFAAQTGRDIAWGAMYFEAKGALTRYMQVDDPATIQEAIDSGRGALLIGAHYGPSLCSAIIHKLGFAVRPLAAGHNVRRYREAARIGPKWLADKKSKFMADEVRAVAFPANGKEMVDHVRGGNVTVVLLDDPLATGGAQCDLFGRAVRFSCLPFKLALKYDVPVFFYYFDRPPKAGYVMRVRSCPAFASPAAGARAYATFLESIVRDAPEMWSGVF